MSSGDTKVGISQSVFAAFSRIELLRAPMFRLYDWILRRKRPYLAFERTLGIDTRGFIPNHALQSGKISDTMSTAYAGAMPSVVRYALAQIPDIVETHFIDIGVGKGRAIAVASELPFKSLTGIELSPDLCAIARRHARIIARRYPQRPPIQILEGDASQPQLPADGPLLVYAYHPFGAGLIATLTQCLIKAAEQRAVFFVYINPVHGGVIDAHPAFVRVFAETVLYTDEEKTVNWDGADAVVIWRAGPEAEGFMSSPNAARPIRVVSEGWRAELG